MEASVRSFFVRLLYKIHPQACCVVQRVEEMEASVHSLFVQLLYKIILKQMLWCNEWKRWRRRCVPFLFDYCIRLSSSKCCVVQRVEEMEASVRSLFVQKSKRLKASSPSNCCGSKGGRGGCKCGFDFVGANPIPQKFVEEECDSGGVIRYPVPKWLPFF